MTDGLYDHSGNVKNPTDPYKAISDIYNNEWETLGGRKAEKERGRKRRDGQIEASGVEIRG